MSYKSSSCWSKVLGTFGHYSVYSLVGIWQMENQLRISPSIPSMSQKPAPKIALKYWRWKSLKNAQVQ